MRSASLIFVFAIFVVFSVDLQAQVSRGVSAAGRRMDDFDNQRRKAEQDRMRGELQGKKPTKEELEAAARIKTETREDLEGLARAA